MLKALNRFTASQTNSGRRYDIGFVGRVYNIARCQFRVGEDVGCLKH